MKTPFIYFGLMVSLLGNLAFAHSNSNVHFTKSESVASFDKGARLTKPEATIESDSENLDQIIAPIAAPKNSETDTLVIEGLKITEDQPQTYQLLTLQPTIMDTILFNESVIESNTFRN
ncbi:MAG: hypothetical protein RLZZ500_2445 [Bacteroidota bacterium]|jgi:hypothetical protein